MATAINVGTLIFADKEDLTRDGSRVIVPGHLSPRSRDGLPAKGKSSRSESVDPQIIRGSEAARGRAVERIFSVISVEAPQPNLKPSSRTLKRNLLRASMLATAMVMATVLVFRTSALVAIFPKNGLQSSLVPLSPPQLPLLLLRPSLLNHVPLS